MKNQFSLIGTAIASLALVQVTTAATTVNFVNLNTADTNALNTLTVGGNDNNLTVSRTLVSGDYLYAITYSGADYDGDTFNDTLSFTVRVNGFTGSTVAHGLSSANTTTNSASATISTTDADVTLNINSRTGAGWTVANSNMNNGNTLKFTLESLTVSAAGYGASFNGFSGFRYEEDGGFGHGYVIGEGNSGLFGRVFNGNGDETLAGLTTLLLTSQEKDGNSNPQRWGVANIDFGITVDAIPEPSTFALLGLGIPGLLFRRRR